MVFAVFCLTWTAPGLAQVPDHLKCYKIKDTLALLGTADLNSPQFGFDPACRIKKAVLFCVPVTTSSLDAIDKTTKEPIVPLRIRGGESGARPDDQLCYKIRCPEPATIADQSATDQFGSRTLSKFKTSLLCVPAFKGTARFVDNGNSITDNYTGLHWMETCCLDGVADYANPLDADNTYTWSNLSGCPFAGCPNGTAFTDLLGRLNACTWSNITQGFLGYAGHCDWRLPTRAELRTILDCSFSPCISPAFGPTAPSEHWASNTSVGLPDVATCINFGTGEVFCGHTKTWSFHVRAVRGGSAD